MSDEWTDRLSEYLDDELPADERTALEAHLRHCARCGAVLADLKRIVTRARGLEDRTPDHDLWPGVAARIGALPAARRRRWSFSLPQLAAAGIALMAISGGAAWLLHPAPGIPGRLPVPATAVTLVGTAPRAATRGYDAAVVDLERVLDAGRGRLDTTTVKVIQRNLAAIDSAIVQAQRAVAADSANLYLNSHLADTRRRKLELLRQAAALVSSVT